MHMHHNAVVQHHVCAVYIINALYCFYYHTLTSSCKVCPFSACMYMYNIIVTEDGQIGCNRGQAK